ncbi:GNAT family N-acetyltransferase [Paraburkholderia domus]|uniref:GNAT family N-acetyltransferase n=1 Tax=Paraburkholderia domus TaxID=2793075 RepID=UPI001912B263|nr:GNAT family N-acetyltransferase [Paraburkholderia domus]MBK5059612.1 GNAT family N-acetyltransferase [Burkholderia sp. R-70199]CAE6845093.1 Spermidine N(1)-acetyltransferase [Paraburkholderia domus]
MKPAYASYVCGAVRIRTLTEADLRETLEWRNRNGVRQNFKHSAALEWNQHHAWFLSYRDKPDDIIFIAEHVASGKKVGQVAIYSIDYAGGRAEIGRFVAAPAFQGKGLMREAITGLMGFAKQELRLNSLYLEVIETNERAYQLYSKLGFNEVERKDGLIFMERSLNGDVQQ